MNKTEKTIISLIKLIVMISNKEHSPIISKILSDCDDYNAALSRLKKECNIKIKNKHSINKRLDSIPLPAILFTNEGEPFILAKYDEQRVLIQNPHQEAPEILDKAEFINSWSGRWIKIKQNSNRFNIRWFIPEFVRQKKNLTEILLFSFVLQILALISPLVVQVVMDKVLVHQAFSTLDVLIFGLITAGLIEVLLRGLREYQYAHTANRIDIKLGLKLVQHLFGLPLLFFKSRQVGAIVTRVRELETVREFLTGSMFTLCIDVLFMFVFIYVMSQLSGVLTLVFLLSIPAYALLAWWVTPKIEQAVEKQFTHAAINTSFLTETVSGAETLKSLAVEPRFIRRWDSQTEKMVSTSYTVQQWDNRSSHLVMLLQKVTSAVIIWLGASEVLSLHMTIGQLIAFNMMVSHTQQPLAKLVQLWGQFIRSRIAIDKLGDMLNLPTEQQSGNAHVALQGAVSFTDIVFRYQPDLPPAINHFTLDIRSGETVGIVGTSGSGKSTLARLLLRLYTPEHGSIMLDGIPLQQLDIESIRQQIGIVLQENFLFNKTVHENLSQSCPDAPLSAIIEAAKLAGAHDFILKLPMGYDTVIAEGGQSLSGGQRQRLAIARTLLSDPRILILDEATSALDDESQAIIQSNMASIARGRTVITIAHRLSTIRQCDRIIVLHQGQIIEQGSHDQLLQQGKHYRKLWQLQQELKQEEGPFHA
ncbi:peptidase domain-containing ABC transporter [Xenorhabdus szentirmaii]|uniref:Alpha-hemolysin translocation ATP-binding protein HlyB n=1 Tax=Xenorhabdus szentirmaii DSM 16338 TaxID=1427518 RepID=W1J2A5_9GAMM|nr:MULTISPECIES: type I secretion system permease/ATPase [Xenorhabdus]MBD2782125.1 type I secretion system permease/ATPase [Xenorhabdus sp. 38]MBD2793477.1 type I secretion system permease/ATPase [Xenorhabdus sp. CUL]MBD2806658.1 type I secretion system permease/ATPase [Xenorhabdus sp. ZM]MBD2822526.1 type I secretion system permease/ATPase [Xenorhabdus sp. 42]MBD2826835.1 type I secretion system permease/ATPase [Xenorhabdus sp. 5]